MSPRLRPASAPEENLATAEVREAIQLVLRRRSVPANDLDDLTHDVIARALAARDLPAELGQCTALVRKMARELAIDASRQGKSRSKVNTGLCDDPDDHALDASPGERAEPGSLREQLDFIVAQVESGAITERQAVILARDAEEVPHAEIAREMKLAYQTVRNELSSGRRSVRSSWAAYASVGLVALVGVVVWLLRGADRTADRTIVPDVTPHESAAPPEPTPLERAAELRREGLHDCDRGYWNYCVTKLGEAARLDPAGASNPEVQKAMAKAQRILNAPPVVDDLKSPK